MAALIVGDQGQIIPYTKIKKWGIFLIFSLTASLFAVSGIGYMMLKKQVAISDLKDRIAVLEKKAAELKEEKDLLMARLVIAEAQLRPAGKTEDKKQNAVEKAGVMPDTPAEAVIPKKEPEKEGAAEDDDAPKTPTAEVKAEETSDVETGSGSVSVAVENVEVTYDARQNLIKAQYVVRNTSVGKVPVSGRCVLVLNHPERAPSQWIPLPKVPLTNGKPGGKLGAAFKIANYKPFSLKTTGPRAPFSFDNGTVFIFDGNGMLIYEKDFPLSLSYRPEPEPKTPQSEVQENQTQSKRSTQNPAAGIGPQAESSQNAAENESEMGNQTQETAAGEEEAAEQSDVDPEIDAMFQVQ